MDPASRPSSLIWCIPPRMCPHAHVRFLWRYHPPMDGEQQGRLDVYNWTGANAYVTLCEPEFISSGGGCVCVHPPFSWVAQPDDDSDGHYGLYIDASLLEGSSAPCPTFGNPPLCSTPPQTGHGRNGVAKARADVPFECVGLEVWGIGQG